MIYVSEKKSYFVCKYLKKDRWSQSRKTKKDWGAGIDVAFNFI